MCRRTAPIIHAHGRRLREVALYKRRFTAKKLGYSHYNDELEYVRGY